MGIFFVQVVGRTFIWLATLGVLVAWLIRLTIRDSLPEYAVAYYASPPSMILAGSVIAAFGWSVRGKRFASGLCYFALVCSFFLWLGTSFQIGSSNREPGDLKVVYWNTARGIYGWHGVFHELQKKRPDVIAICEACMTPADLDEWKSAFPNYETTDVSGQLLILSRPKIDQIEYCNLRMGRYKRIRFETKQGPIQLMLVDIESNPRTDRDTLFAEVMSQVRPWMDEPLLVVGDFNTPRDSVHFRHFENQLRNAFDSCGRGYAPTWPVPFPVLTIDHAWHNHRLSVTQFRHDWTRFSDHRPLVMHVRPSFPVSKIDQPFYTARKP